MKVTPFETYQTYLSVKNHFSNPKYDYFKYGGRSRAKIAAFNKRKDKYWFEKTSRKYPDKEIVEFLVSNFVSADNPQTLWIGEIMNSGDKIYSEWSKTQQSLGYIFKDKITDLLDNNELEDLEGNLTGTSQTIHQSYCERDYEIRKKTSKNCRKYKIKKKKKKKKKNF